MTHRITGRGGDSYPLPIRRHLCDIDGELRPGPGTPWLKPPVAPASPRHAVARHCVFFGTEATLLGVNHSGDAATGTSALRPVPSLYDE